MFAGRCPFRVLTAFVALLMAQSFFVLWAQSISGVIAGVIRDQQGAVLAGATITVSNPTTGRSWSASANESGYYRVPEIPSGSYDVTVEVAGLQTEKHVSVMVSVDQVTLENFQLQVSGQKSIVVVNSTATLLDTVDSTLRYSFTERQMQELPLLSRDINTVALLAPGVASVRTFSFASTLVPFSVNGSRGRDNNFVIDSVNNNEPLFGGAAAQFTNTDIFSDFTILTHQQEAEYGDNSGATVNAITRSGSNNLHGTAFWFGQNGDFNALTSAESAAGLTSPPASFENVLGATVGGPIQKDRTFFFISYQWDRASDNLSQIYPVLSTLPNINGLATLEGLPPTPSLNALLAVPTVAQVARYYGAPCFSSVPAPGFNAANPCLVNSTPVPVMDGEKTESVDFNVFNIPNANLFDVRDHQFSVRVDHKLNEDNDFYGRYLFDDLLAPNVPLSTAGDAAFNDLGQFPDSALLTRQRVQNLALDERYYRSNALNELRFSYSRIAQGIGAYNEPSSMLQTQPAATVYDEFGGFGQYSNNFLSAGNNFTIGQNSRPSIFDSNTYQLQENYSYTTGRHSLKFGADITAIGSTLLSVPQDLGQYVYGNRNAPGGLNSFLNEPAAGPTNAVVSFQRFANLQVNGGGQITGQGSEALPLLTFNEAVFAQDDMQLPHHLAVNIGLRYEYFGQPINQLHNMNSNAPLVSTDTNNFGPRFGFAWAPIENLVVRGGYGIMYDPVIFEIPLLIWQSAPISPLVASINGPGGTVVQPSGVFPNSPFSLSDLNNAKVASCGPYQGGSGLNVAGSVPIINCSNENTASSNFVNPYVQNYSLGVQYELPASWLFAVGWVGSKGTKLFLRQDLNPYQGWIQSCLDAPGGNNNNIACLKPRSNADAGDITSVTNQGDSTYNSLQATMTKRYSHTRAGNVAVTTAYTWSHFIDNTSEIFGPSVQFVGQEGFLSAFQSPRTNGLQSVEAITPFAQNPEDLSAEKGNSSFDRRQRLAASYLWEPFPDKGRWLGGWQFNGIISVQSGQPFSALNGSPLGFCADAFGEGQLTNDRPAIGNPNAPVNSVALLADPSCVSTAASAVSPTGYVNLAGQPIDPGAARFVQEPVGTSPGQPFTVTATGETFMAGSDGRNTLVGPGLVNWDAALIKNFTVWESKTIQLRWEVYDLLNHPNPGFAIGNVYAANAQPTPAYAFGASATPASVTGVIPENSIDAIDGSGNHTFLTQKYMNTSSRTMQFGLKFIF